MIKLAGIPFAIKYEAYDAGPDELFIRADVWDVTELPDPPVLVEQIPLTRIGDKGMYAGLFTGLSTHVYVIEKLVYTDNTYATLNTDRSTDADDVQCVEFNIPPNADIVAEVDDDEEL